MRFQIRELAEVQIGYQARGRLEPSTSGTHLLVQMRDIDQFGEIDSAGLARFIPEGESGRYSIRSGDVLFQARGNRNMASLVRELAGDTLASNHFYIARPRAESVLPAYLAWYLNQPVTQVHLAVHAQGTTMMLVPKEAFERIWVDIPDLATQHRIVELDRLRQREKRLTEQLDRLRDRLAFEVSIRAARNMG